MPRIKLQEQPTYEFEHTLTVRVTDLNYGGHLANTAVVGLVHEARVQLLRTLGCSEFNLGDDQTGLVIGDLVVNFRAEGFLTDTLRIESHIGEISVKSFRVFHRICRENSLLALVETGLITFDYARRKAAPVPKTFLQKLEAYQHSGERYDPS